MLMFVLIIEGFHGALKLAINGGGWRNKYRILVERTTRVWTV
jgi:hypothetical protein